MASSSSSAAAGRAGAGAGAGKTLAWKSRPVVDLPLPTGTRLVSEAAFSFLFSEMLQYTQTRSESLQHVQKRLEELGFGVGERILELLRLRERGAVRESDHVRMLQFVHVNVWKHLFGRQSGGLEQSTASKSQYYIFEPEPITDKYVSVPKSMSGFSCASFLAGIIHGVLDAAELPCKVETHFTSEEVRRTVFVITFDDVVMRRAAT